MSNCSLVPTPSPAGDQVLGALRDPTRRTILLDFYEDPRDRTVDEVAAAIGVHRTVAFQHLERLLALGYLATNRRRGLRGKPAKVYRLALWNLVDTGGKLGRDGRRALAEYADFVIDSWRRPDAGLWEVRDEPAHHVHSKVWAWIALDRAARTAHALGTSRTRAARWERERDLLAEDIRCRGFDADRGCYVRAYGSRELDAALLLLPLTGFDGDGQERLSATVDAIWHELGAGDPLLYRYPPGHDGLPGAEGAFVPCSFWLLEALLRLGRKDEGLRLFEQVLDLANELLLLPEEIDPATGAYLGNYPLALSQAGLVHSTSERREV